MDEGDGLGCLLAVRSFLSVRAIWTDRTSLVYGQATTKPELPSFSTLRTLLNLHIKPPKHLFQQTPYRPKPHEQKTYPSRPIFALKQLCRQSVLRRDELPRMRSCGAELGAFERKDGFGVLFHGGVARAEVILDLEYITFAQRSAVVYLG